MSKQVAVAPVIAKEKEFASTGIEDLDRILDGGFTPGFTTLLVAPVGCGAEIFAKQYAASHGEEFVVYVTTAETKKDVERSVEEANWPFGALDIVDMQTTFAKQSKHDHESGKAPITRHRMAPVATVDPDDLLAENTNTDLLENLSTTEEYGTTEYLPALLKEYEREPRPERLIVNNLDFFFNIYPAEQVIQYLNMMRSINADGKGQLLWVLSAGVVPEIVVNRLALMADCFLEMERQRKGNEFERYLIIHNVRNRPEKTGANTYHVDKNGIKIQNVSRIA
jgi:KaiC/GvpD/RAD55 family RecA-like ATPase